MQGNGVMRSIRGKHNSLKHRATYKNTELFCCLVKIKNQDGHSKVNTTENQENKHAPPGYFWAFPKELLNAV